MQDSFVINLIPCSEHDELLTNLKEYFYSQDFKYTSKGLPSRPHLTIAKFTAPKDMTALIQDLSEVLATQSTIVAKVDSIADEIKSTPKYPDGEGWVALLFNDEHIKTLYYNLNELLDKHGCNTNSGYIEAIKQIKGEHLQTFDCIANHINICNRCKPEKVTIAKAYIQSLIPTHICFDRLIIRCTITEEEDVRYMFELTKL